MSDPFDPLCTGCGLPYSLHDRDADLEDQQARIAEFRREVATRVEQKMAHYHAVSALADLKVAQAHGESPRVAGRAVLQSTKDAEARELAFIAAYDRQKNIYHRAARKVMEHHIRQGIASFITSDGRILTELGKTVLITPSMRTEYFAAKDAIGLDDPAFETRDGLV